MKRTELSAGDKIDARCSKCGGTTRHIILAISGQTPNRVRCDLCDREHNYQPPRAERIRTPRAPSTRQPVTRRKVDPREAERQQWLELNPELGAGQLLPYAMDGRFPLASRVNHPTFGVGVVVGHPGPHKVEILFREGKKVLRCA